MFMQKSDSDFQSPRIIKDSRLSSLTSVLPFTSVVSVAIIILLMYAFFSGILFRFYASALFLFYAVTQHMWVSVILLGVFQTLVLVPLRIAKVWRSQNINEFQGRIKKIDGQTEQLQQIRKEFDLGNRAFLFYIVDFMIQLSTFLTIGRLFLTDFYTSRLDPSHLYNFIPYPEYPIQHTFFKIPYFIINQSTNLGWKIILPVWIVLLVVQIVILIMRDMRRGSDTQQKGKLLKWSKYATGYFFISVVLSFLLLTHFPTQFQFKIFSGDVSKPNPTFNSITAVVTFITLLWFGISKILKKGQLAQEQGVDQKIIDATQKQMLKNSFVDSTLVGLGAYFITNQIPSAFELSIFTLEIISLTSPFTLDKVIERIGSHPQITVPAESEPA